MLAVTVGIALLTAACGGSPSSTASGGSPNAGRPSPAGSSGSANAAESAQSQQLAFARCMRAHGVTDYPDSGGPIEADPRSDLDPSNPTYQAARQACQSLRPTEHLSPAQAAKNNADALKFANCMRKHGITKYPDPVPDGGSNDQINLSGIRNLLGTPQFLAAQQACKHYLSPYGKGA